MTTSTKAWVARERWRADLLEYGAALLDTVDMDTDATNKRAEAEARRLVADATEYYAEIGETDGFKSPTAKQAARQLRSARAAYRSGSVNVGLVNNFSEPTDQELEAGAA